MHSNERKLHSWVFNIYTIILNIWGKKEMKIIFQEDNWTPNTRSTTHSEEVTKKFMQKPLEVTYVQYDLKYNNEIQTERRKSLWFIQVPDVAPSLLKTIINCRIWSQVLEARTMNYKSYSLTLAYGMQFDDEEMYNTMRLYLHYLYLLFFSTILLVAFVALPRSTCYQRQNSIQN